MGGAKLDRKGAVERYLELRPLVRARMEAVVPAELHEEFSRLTSRQLRALLCLPQEGLTMRQLAETLGVMAATASVLADRLVAQGLVERRPEECDRRVVRLVPTASGARLAERANRAQRQVAEALFRQLRDDQVGAFLDAMEAMAGEGRRESLSASAPSRQEGSR